MMTLAQIAPGAALEDDLRDFCATAEARTAILPERQLAAKYGITHAAVRRVLERLIADELIYREHGRGTFVAERRAASLKSLLIVDSWNRLGHPYFSGRLRGIMAAAKDHGLNVEVFDAPPMDTAAFHDRVAREEIQGVLVPWVSRELVARLRRARPHLAIVSTGRVLYDSTVAHVAVDYDAMGAMAADSLLERGCRRPVLIYSQRATVGGFLQRCEAAGVHGQVVFVSEIRDAQLIQAAYSDFLDLDADGLAIDDEYITGAVFSRHPVPDVPFITQATVGHDLPVRGVPLLAVDPMAMGRMIVCTLHNMIAYDTYRQSTLLARPTLVEPVP